VAAITILYNPLASLQITVRQPEALWIVAVTLGVAIALGLLAAFGGWPMRNLVLALTALIWIDIALPLPSLFERLSPAQRAVRQRDQQRLADIETIQRALEAHITAHGGLPRPEDYGEQMGPPNFWGGWWDVSSQDGDGDGIPFLDFLVERGVVLSVPIDPSNHPSEDGVPTGGSQYAYFVVPSGYDYEGGQCEEHRGYSTYLLGITDLELETTRPPQHAEGSGCECLWKDKPNFFQDYFDYVLCGRFRP
jgi:hypothetical protein